MHIRRTCSWCHGINVIQAVGPTVCQHCGHRGDLPRSLCDCPTCRRPCTRPCKITAPSTTPKPE